MRLIALAKKAPAIPSKEPQVIICLTLEALPGVVV
jgi:hypothetical protein